MLPVLNDSLLRMSRNSPCCWLANCTACCTLTVLPPPFNRLGSISMTPDAMATNMKMRLFWSRKKSTLYPESAFGKKTEFVDYKMDREFQLLGDFYHA